MVKHCVGFNPDFRTGNSGNFLQTAVVKVGPGCQQEGAYCQYLGEDVSPKIYAIIPNGYVMQLLESAPRLPNLLMQIEFLLARRVWNRPALPNTIDMSWQEKLRTFGINAPSWAIETDPCLVHGDPTASNALMNCGRLVLCDPRPPRDFIPQCRETDMGRILQSFFGWETAAYNSRPVNFTEPNFIFDPNLYRAAKFWCGAAAARIECLERTRTIAHDGSSKHVNILSWCAKIRKMCDV